MSHHCHARDCTVSVPPEMLMCKKHWFMLPPNIRSAVWRTYRPGQCDDKNPSEAWHVAADAAIGYVAAKEGKPLRACEGEALLSAGFALSPDAEGILRVGRMS